jgi:hypothetical protein
MVFAGERLAEKVSSAGRGESYMQTQFARVRYTEDLWQSLFCSR